MRGAGGRLLAAASSGGGGGGGTVPLPAGPAPRHQAWATPWTHLLVSSMDMESCSLPPASAPSPRRSSRPLIVLGELGYDCNARWARPRAHRGAAQAARGAFSLLGAFAVPVRLLHKWISCGSAWEGAQLGMAHPAAEVAPARSS